MEKTLPFSMRFDVELKAQLQRLAETDDRSLTNYIERVLRNHVRDVQAAKRGDPSNRAHT